METNEKGIMFNFKVKKDHPVLAEFKKKSNKKVGILCLIAALPFTLFLIMCSFSNNPSSIALGIFGGFVVLCVGLAIYYFATTKPSKKDADTQMEFEFMEYGIAIYQRNLVKNSRRELVKCLYNAYKNKQFISKFIENENSFKIKVYTGTYNGVPQYKQHLFPKSIIGDEELLKFKDFMLQKMGNDYIRK